MENIPIRKRNFIHYYSKGQEKAFSIHPGDNQEATGMHPFNRDAIPKSAFAPALNTTTQPAQPIPAALPKVLTPMPNRESTATLSTMSTETPAIVPAEGSDEVTSGNDDRNHF